jgi:hypothetical protein
MNTRGRPKGAAKVYFRAYVTPEQAKVLGVLVERARNGDPLAFTGMNHVGEVKIPPYEQKVAASKETASVGILEHQPPYDQAAHAEEDHAAKVLLNCWRNMNVSKPTTPEDMVGLLKGFCWRPEDMSAFSELKKHNRQLLEDIEKLTKENADLQVRLQRCSEATDDQKAIWWMTKYKQLEGSLKKGEFDQERP